MVRWSLFDWESRCYPVGFGQCLLKAWENRTPFPAHMRHRLNIDLTKTDRELFESLPLGDVWIDGKMHLVWKYIYTSKHVSIPSSWENAMKRFDDELTKRAAQLHMHICMLFGKYETQTRCPIPLNLRPAIFC